MQVLMRHLTASGAVLLLSFAATVSVACDAIGKDGKPVSVSTESAIIIWDDKTHTERFIRSADFQTKAREIGFLVPTPSIPKLMEANSEEFVQLLQVVESHRRATEAATAGVVAAKADDSSVVSQQTVGGFEETVLSTAHPQSIDSWLSRHGFPKTKETTEWLKPYIRKNWFITAYRFKGNGSSADLRPVCMTFHSEMPFYPYREPASKSTQEGGRTLRVFLLSNEGQEAVTNGQPWVATTEWTGMLSDSDLRILGPVVANLGLLKTPSLTSFLDDSSPRLGTDEVYFRPLPPPILTSATFRWSGIFILSFWGLFGLYLVFRRRLTVADNRFAN